MILTPHIDDLSDEQLRARRTRAFRSFNYGYGVLRSMFQYINDYHPASTDDAPIFDGGQYVPLPYAHGDVCEGTYLVDGTIIGTKTCNLWGDCPEHSQSAACAETTVTV